MPCNFFPWGYVKLKVYANNPTIFEDLKTNIRTEEKEEEGKTRRRLQHQTNTIIFFAISLFSWGRKTTTLNSADISTILLLSSDLATIFTNFVFFQYQTFICWSLIRNKDFIRVLRNCRICLLSRKELSRIFPTLSKSTRGKETRRAVLRVNNSPGGKRINHWLKFRADRCNLYRHFVWWMRLYDVPNYL